MITIYGKNNCYWCKEAKGVAKRYNLECTYKNIALKEFHTEMFELVPDAKSVPQIFWNERYIGGYEEFVTEVENTLGSHYAQDLF